ncbi:MAG: rRNA pseudouridine synthase [Planctomycetes bacterium]|nr:rRNA pseudouridine synthase [Planctomycetota bacterium]
MKASEADDIDSSGGIRLQRFLAMAGAGSRRHCEEYILTGRVTVNRQTIHELGYRVIPGEHDERLDGERVRLERKVWYVLNKPVGYLCTNSDPAGRARVIDLFPPNRERLFSVGRLDENSQGLLLVTNDGELAHHLAHPRFRVRKIYQVQVAGVPTRELLEQLKRGMYFAEGRFKVADVKFLRTKGASSLLEITLTEGQNREIRRLLAKLGHKVQRLERVALGPVQLGDLPLGAYRPLTPGEISALHELVQGDTSRRTKRSANSGKSKSPKSAKSGSARPAGPRRSTGSARRSPGKGRPRKD